jgi:uncharacterized RDD family membrane protein YckC
MIDINKRVGFGERLGSHIIDLILISVIISILLPFILSPDFTVIYQQSNQFSSTFEEAELEREFEETGTEIMLKLTPYINNEMSEEEFITQFELALEQVLIKVFTGQSEYNPSVIFEDIDAFLNIIIDVAFDSFQITQDNQIPPDVLTTAKTETKAFVKSTGLSVFLQNLAVALLNIVRKALLISSILTFIYFALEGFTGVTPGKLIFGIKVAAIDGKKDIITLLTRTLIKNSAYIVGISSAFLFYNGRFLVAIQLSYLSSFIYLILIIGFFITLSSNRQGIHDMIAKTAVFKKKDLGIL